MESDWMISYNFVPAPILSPFLSHFTYLSLSTIPKSTTSLGRMSLCFIFTRRSVPPARIAASLPCSESTFSIPLTFLGERYSKDESLISHLLFWLQELKRPCPGLSGVPLSPAPWHRRLHWR